MFLLKMAFGIVLEKISPGDRLLIDKGLDVLNGMVRLENHIVDVEQTARLKMLRILARAIPFQRSGR